MLVATPGVNVVATTSYEYPATIPTQFNYWASFTGVGDPTSTPLNWFNDGSSAAMFDNGIEWEDDYGYITAAPGQFGICNFQTGAYTSPYSNVVLLLP